MSRLAWFLAALALFLSGCASNPPPPLRLVPVEITPYDLRKDDYNLKLALEAFCAKHGREADYENRTCKAR